MNSIAYQRYTATFFEGELAKITWYGNNAQFMRQKMLKLLDEDSHTTKVSLVDNNTGRTLVSKEKVA